MLLLMFVLLLDIGDITGSLVPPPKPLLPRLLGNTLLLLVEGKSSSFSPGLLFVCIYGSRPFVL